MIAVDTNVIAYLFLPGPHTRAAEELLARDSRWAAPRLWRSEFRNILAGFMRRRSLTPAQALAMQVEAEDLLAGTEYDVESAAVLALVERSDCSAYDCEFVAVAERLETRLFTLDAKILRAFPERASRLGTP